MIHCIFNDVFKNVNAGTCYIVLPPPISGIYAEEDYVKIT